MNSKKLAGLFSIIIISILFFVNLFLGRYELFSYMIIPLFALAFMFWSDKFYNYSLFIIWSFCIWAILHIVGGIYFSGIRLFDLILIPLIGEPYNILRYDQVLHVFCSIILGMISYTIVSKYIKRKIWVIFLIAALISVGIGNLNEIAEFSVVVFFANNGIGDYFNNALDLVANLLGTLLGVLIMHKRYKR
jgi:uncharacterized membrane protein YjdF